MFILAKGQVAKEPYEIPFSGVSVYSLEELCYYIYNHIYQVTEEFFDGKLVIWLREQAKCETAAKKMKVLIERHNDIKDLVVTLLCSCDYYREEEIVELVKVMEKISNLPVHKKLKIKGDMYLSTHRYGKSLSVYRELLFGEMAECFTTEEYGDILHNQAIALFHMSSFQEAARGFEEAYARNQKAESKRQYLCTLLLTGQEDVFVKEAARLEVPREEIEKLKQDCTYEITEAGASETEDAFVEACKEELRASCSGEDFSPGTPEGRQA